jgi:hypothetical protein
VTPSRWSPTQEISRSLKRKSCSSRRDAPLRSGIIRHFMPNSSHCSGPPFGRSPTLRVVVRLAAVLPVPFHFALLLRSRSSRYVHVSALATVLLTHVRSFSRFDGRALAMLSAETPFSPKPVNISVGDPRMCRFSAAVPNHVLSKLFLTMLCAAATIASRASRGVQLSSRRAFSLEVFLA